MANVKRSLMAVLALIVILALGLQNGLAANMTNDDFTGTTLGNQWVDLSSNGGYIAQDDVLTCTANGSDATYDRAGVENASGYVVAAGDFSVQVDVDVTSTPDRYDRFFMGVAEGGATGDSTSYINWYYWDTVGGGRWGYTAYIYLGGVESGTIINKSGYLSGGMDWQIKTERVGNTLTQYARLLGSTGAWTILNSRNGGPLGGFDAEGEASENNGLFTSDEEMSVIKLRMQQHAAAGIVVELDNFMVPEPATLCLLAVGGIGVLLRRRRS